MGKKIIGAISFSYQITWNETRNQQQESLKILAKQMGIDNRLKKKNVPKQFTKPTISLIPKLYKY